MAEIVKLNSPEIAWRQMEDNIRMVARDRGYGSEVADWVVADIRQRGFQLEYATPNWDDFSVEVRPHLATVLEVHKQIHIGIMVDWLLRVAMLECELWVAKFAAKG